MKQIILALLLISSPAAAQQMRGSLDTRTTDTERANNRQPYVAPPEGKLQPPKNGDTLCGLMPSCIARHKVD